MTTMIFCDKCDEIITNELKGKSIVRFYDMIQVIGNQDTYIGTGTVPKKSFHLCTYCTQVMINYIKPQKVIA